jgi:hypothetical protein
MPLPGGVIHRDLKLRKTSCYSRPATRLNRRLRDRAGGGPSRWLPGEPRKPGSLHRRHPALHEPGAGGRRAQHRCEIRPSTRSRRWALRDVEPASRLTPVLPAPGLSIRPLDDGEAPEPSGGPGPTYRGGWIFAVGRALASRRPTGIPSCERRLPRHWLAGMTFPVRLLYTVVDAVVPSASRTLGHRRHRPGCDGCRSPGA